MKRRKFLRNIGLASGFSLAGVPVGVMADAKNLQRLAAQSNNDRVLIILQMHGGNDGLNTLIPVEQYDLYYSRRANIAIPAKNSARKYIDLDSTLAFQDQVGLHPDMIGVKELYDRGRVGFVQGVSYKNNNGSHFRGRDILFMGGNSTDYFSSGWIGRYLQNEFKPLTYPDDFPNEEMKDPLALEMGSDVSLVFHQQGNIPASISIDGVEGFAELVDTLQGFDDTLIDPRGKPPASLDNSPYGKELNWILGLEDKSEDYAQRLLEVYEAGGETSVTYPETYPFAAGSKNPLSRQLKIIARLLKGGSKTKVFLVRIGGFDTHADQVESYDSTLGSHAALLYHISSAMKAFQEDLQVRGLEDRALTVTMSEFGRRIASNGSFGCDHGKGGPVMLFGKGVNPGMTGTNPDVSKKNVEMQFDYRQIYATILKDWLCVDADVVNNDVFFGNFIDGEVNGVTYSPLSIINQNPTALEDFRTQRFRLNPCFPNPVSEKANLSFYINTPAKVTLKVTDLQGRVLQRVLHHSWRGIGEHQVELDVSNWKPGAYLYQIEAGVLKDTRKLIVRH